MNFEVRARPNEEPDRLIRRFMKKGRDAKVADDLRRHQWYEKPSVRRRQKRERARWLARQATSP